MEWLHHYIAVKVTDFIHQEKNYNDTETSVFGGRKGESVQCQNEAHREYRGD